MYEKSITNGSQPVRWAIKTGQSWSWKICSPARWVCKRVSKIDSKISIATVYRTVKLFEESGILTKHEFKGGKARYEELNEGHHDHLIDVKTGEIIEFVDNEIEILQKKVAEKHGYKLVDHKLELYGVKINSKDE